MRTLFVSTIFLAVVSSCISSKEEKSLLWKNDSLGLNGTRNQDLLEELIDQWQLDGKRYKAVKVILGPSTSYYEIGQDIPDTSTQVSYFCCGHYFDENGDGSIDSISEFIRSKLEIRSKHGKWQINKTMVE